MPIVSGGSGGGGLPTGWTQDASNPANVNANGGHLASVDVGGSIANLTPGGLFLSSTGVFLELTNGADDVFVVQQASVGEVIIGAGAAAPPNGDLTAGQLALWLDPTNGAAKLKLKGKSADGTVVTADIALT